MKTFNNLDLTFELLFENYIETSAHNELKNLKTIVSILEQNEIPFRCTGEGVDTPYGIISNELFKSAPQIYSYSYADWKTHAKRISDRNMINISPSGDCFYVVKYGFARSAPFEKKYLRNKAFLKEQIKKVKAEYIQLTRNEQQA